MYWVRDSFTLINMAGALKCPDSSSKINYDADIDEASVTRLRQLKRSPRSAAAVMALSKTLYSTVLQRDCSVVRQ